MADILIYLGVLIIIVGSVYSYAEAVKGYKGNSRGGDLTKIKKVERLWLCSLVAGLLVAGIGVCAVMGHSVSYI